MRLMRASISRIRRQIISLFSPIDELRFLLSHGSPLTRSCASALAGFHGTFSRWPVYMQSVQHTAHAAIFALAARAYAPLSKAISIRADGAYFANALGRRCDMLPLRGEGRRGLSAGRERGSPMRGVIYHGR